MGPSTNIHRHRPAVRLAVLLACLAWAGPAAAEDALTVNHTDCLKIVKHVPAADVAYQPGVDVRGRPVVSADVAGSNPIAVPKDFTIDITVRIDKRFGVPATSELFRPGANIGVVTVKGDKVYFNGQPLATESVDELAAICRELTKTK